MLELTLRSTAILALAWLLTRALRRATPATRHLLWHGALIAVLIAPLAHVVSLPKVPVVPDVHVAQLLRTPERAPHDVMPAHSSITSDLDGATALSVWASAGSLAVGLWFAAGWIAAARLGRRAKAAPLAWQLELNALCERLRIHHSVTLGLVDQPCSPLATGLMRHRILLPAAAAGWSDDRRRAVLLHELAHIRRRDTQGLLVAHLACAMYWFNPMVWLAAAHLRSERERACDDQVLHLGAQASSYAAHLLDIARELRTPLRTNAGLAMARPSELEGRLLSVLAAGRARVPFRATRWAVVLAVALITATALSASPGSPSPVPISTTSPRYIVGFDDPAAYEPAREPLAATTETLTSSPDPQLRERATMALALTSGRDVIPALLQALGDSSSQVREKAAIGLALRRDARVVEPLLDALGDADAGVREKAAIALGTTGDPRARDALTDALHDPDPQVRKKAAGGLVLLGVTR